MKVPTELDEYYRLRPYNCFHCNKFLNVHSGAEVSTALSEGKFTFVYPMSEKEDKDNPYGEEGIGYHVLCCGDCQLRYYIIPRQEEHDKKAGWLPEK